MSEYLQEGSARSLDETRPEPFDTWHHHGAIRTLSVDVQRIE